MHFPGMSFHFSPNDGISLIFAGPADARRIGVPLGNGKPLDEPVDVGADGEGAAELLHGEAAGGLLKGRRCEDSGHSGLAVVVARAQLDEGTDFGSEHGQQEGQGFCLRLKPVDDAHDAVGLTEAHALKERVEIESGVARDGLTELFGGDLALRMEKRELFDLLCGSKEVALHHIGEVVERLGGHDELVAGESCLEPGGELCAFHGRAVYDGGLALKRPPPRLLRDRPVGGGHRDERDDAVDRVVKILHDGGRAVLARIPRGETHVDDLAIVEHADVGGGHRQARPVR